MISALGTGTGTDDDDDALRRASHRRCDAPAAPRLLPLSATAGSKWYARGSHPSSGSLKHPTVTPLESKKKRRGRVVLSLIAGGKEEDGGA